MVIVLYVLLQCGRIRFFQQLFTQNFMDHRQHPRIQIPLLVELSHPAVGQLQTTARDISAGGLFVRMPNPKIKVGGKLKIRLLTLTPTDTQPTPTVDMEVKRVTDEGLGLAFINKTAEHLWSSVQHLRNELAIGRDYFQIHQSVAAVHPDKGVLLVQQNGKWLLPGHYLMVGEDALQTLRAHVEQNLNLTLGHKISPVATDSAPQIGIAEAATFSVIYTTVTDSHGVELSDSCGYKDWRWLAKPRDVAEITFAVTEHREAVELLLEQQLGE